MPGAVVNWPSHEKDHRKVGTCTESSDHVIPELEDLQYEERLAQTKFTTLERSQERGDVIVLHRLLLE